MKKKKSKSDDNRIVISTINKVGTIYDELRTEYPEYSHEDIHSLIKMILLDENDWRKISSKFTSMKTQDAKKVKIWFPEDLVEPLLIRLKSGMKLNTALKEIHKENSTFNIESLSNNIPIGAELRIEYGKRKSIFTKHSTYMLAKEILFYHNTNKTK